MLAQPLITKAVSNAISIDRNMIVSPQGILWLAAVVTAGPAVLFPDVQGRPTLLGFHW